MQPTEHAATDVPSRRKPTRICGIYAIQHMNGKAYIGSSMNVDARWKAHVHVLGKGNHSASRLQELWNADGRNAFTFIVLLHCDRNDLAFCEQWQIDALGREMLLNGTMTVQSPSLDPDVAAKISAKRKGMPMPHLAESNRKHPRFKGRTHTAESLAKMSQARLGKRFGPHSEITKERIAAALRGKPLTAERRANISKSRKGKPLSDATRAHLVSLHVLTRMRAAAVRSLSNGS